jgi:hypothetical protein
MMCLLCSKPVHRRNLCYQHWREARAERYHCTWKPCTSPIFALTLCRHHYRAANVNCIVPDCKRASFCKQVCQYHYRKKVFPPLLKCSECTQDMYMNGKCFKHFIGRSCIQCDRPTFCKQMCHRHYMRRWRAESGRRTGPTTNREVHPETASTIPETTNQSPAIQSSG